MLLLVEEAKTEIINKLVDKIRELVSKEVFDEDATDRISSKIREIFNSILDGSI